MRKPGTPLSPSETATSVRPLRVLCLIESKAFEYDNRCRAQMNTLVEAGASVAVIAPGERGTPIHEHADGIHLYTYRKPSLAGVSGHFLEYLISLLSISALSLFVLLRHGVDIVEVTNPPDILWPVTMLFRLFRKRIVFDHQDPVPELLESRFGSHARWLMRIVRAMERISFQLGDHVIANNDSSREIAMRRGGRRPEDITIVRNAPDLSRSFQAAVPDPEVERLGDVVIAYLGNMNPQDQVGTFLEMADLIVNEHCVRNVGFVMIGGGDSFRTIKARRDELGLSERISMPGRLPWDRVLSALAAADICIQPDLPSPYTRLITMCKLVEYMALGKACVAFDLPETRVSGGDTVSYVTPYSAEALAAAVAELARDPGRRAAMGAAARQRVRSELAWEHQSPRFLSVFERLLPGRLRVPPDTPA